MAYANVKHLADDYNGLMEQVGDCRTEAYQAEYAKTLSPSSSIYGYWNESKRALW